jgi:hypothetical protein
MGVDVYQLVAQWLRHSARAGGVGESATPMRWRGPVNVVAVRARARTDLQLARLFAQLPRSLGATQRG